MARRPRITEASVAKLGAERLAALLVAEAGKHKALKQALQLALESDQGVESLAAGIRQRLISIGKSKSRLSTNKGKEIVAELQRLRLSITTDVADAEPAEALSLMWQMLDLNVGLIERTRDRAGRLLDFFAETLPLIGELANRARPATEQLVDDVYQRFVADGFGVCDALVPPLADALGADGLAMLRDRLLVARTEHDAEVERLPANPYHQARRATFQMGIRQVADASGDIDALVATFDRDALRMPDVAVEVAERMIEADRADEALVLLEKAAIDSDDAPELQMRFGTLWTDALGKLGRHEELKAAHLELFHKYLSADHLRAYLKLLPDFDDVEAEDAALDWVAQHPVLPVVALFLVRWPALERAARVVRARHEELDGDYHEALLPAADALDGKHPLAAVLLRRAAISHTLKFGRSHRFKQALYQVRQLAALDATIENYDGHDDHRAFMEMLWLEHPHMIEFWDMVESE